ncbi:MAG: hypothetical protein ACREXV_08365 [Polaromonas sp.]
MNISHASIEIHPLRVRLNVFKILPLEAEISLENGQPSDAPRKLLAASGGAENP